MNISVQNFDFALEFPQNGKLPGRILHLLSEKNDRLKFVLGAVAPFPATTLLNTQTQRQTDGRTHRQTDRQTDMYNIKPHWFWHYSVSGIDPALNQWSKYPRLSSLFPLPFSHFPYFSTSIHWSLSTWMGDCLRTGKPSPYITNHRCQLSRLSLRGRSIEYWSAWLGLRRGHVHQCRMGCSTARSHMAGDAP